MLNYPIYLDENVSRPIALTVFTGAFVTLLRPEFSWLMYFLLVDFILRYIHPKLSPLVFINSSISKSILNTENRPKFSPPKRFAMLIGIIFSGSISLTIALNFVFAQQVITILLLVAAFLQGFYEYCVGCAIYDFLVKIGLISSNPPIHADIPNPVNIK
ncbi:MAG: hypothetical protein HeimC2_39450 [Candidatus Heimdallarchaeota archaeon LC_2]|nr:MAG: hypothetical protein HeimC2_39450 [Candidatus Heimdallarchaeota archaeon LC_2]